MLNFIYSRTNQEALEEAFIPTLRTIFHSPINHPLSNVDAEHVAMFMVHLTSWDYLSKGASGKQVSCDEFIVMKHVRLRNKNCAFVAQTVSENFASYFRFASTIKQDLFFFSNLKLLGGRVTRSVAF